MAPDADADLPLGADHDEGGRPVDAFGSRHVLIGGK
jgi:hypothetical protein